MSSLTSGWILAKLSSSSLAVGSSDAELFMPNDSVVGVAAWLAAAVVVAAGAWLVAAVAVAAGVVDALAQPASRASASALGTSLCFNIPIPLR